MRCMHACSTSEHAVRAVVKPLSDLGGSVVECMAIPRFLRNWVVSQNGREWVANENLRLSRFYEGGEFLLVL